MTRPELLAAMREAAIDAEGWNFHEACELLHQLCEVVSRTPLKELAAEALLAESDVHTPINWDGQYNQVRDEATKALFDRIDALKVVLYEAAKQATNERDIRVYMHCLKMVDEGLVI